MFNAAFLTAIGLEVRLLNGIIARDHFESIVLIRRATHVDLYFVTLNVDIILVDLLQCTNLLLLLLFSLNHNASR